MKVAITTLGCRVNVYESEAMLEKFVREGYEVVPFDDFSDVYVINTCTVTNMGDKKSRQLIRRAKRQNPNAIVAVVGCYSQIASDEIKNIEGVNVILGTRNKGEIVYWVNRSMDENSQVVKVGDVLKNRVFEQLKIEDYADKTRAFLKIQDGCNRFCSYCLIPYARGAVCSKPIDVALGEIRELSEHGFKEIILSGIHTASYGVDLEGNVNLITLLEEIENVYGIERVRIGSIDPTFFTEEVIKKVASFKKMCPHFHLSLQSGCDETLKRMNRRYTAEEYKVCVENLRKYIKDVSITTDVIVGFPGETEEEFEKTYNFLRDIKLSKMHVFKYSPRKGTKAAEMNDAVMPEIKEERSKRLLDLNKKNEHEFMQKFIGKNVEVLYEQSYKGEEDWYEGYTPNYIRVISKSSEDLSGKIATTKLTNINEEIIIGEI